MGITLNGENKDYTPSMTVVELLQSLGIKPGAVVVERNFKIVARAEFEREIIEEGDTIEIIRLVGGG